MKGLYERVINSTTGKILVFGSNTLLRRCLSLEEYAPIGVLMLWQPFFNSVSYGQIERYKDDLVGKAVASEHGYKKSLRVWTEEEILYSGLLGIVILAGLYTARVALGSRGFRLIDFWFLVGGIEYLKLNRILASISSLAAATGRFQVLRLTTAVAAVVSLSGYLSAQAYGLKGFLIAQVVLSGLLGAYSFRSRDWTYIWVTMKKIAVRAKEWHGDRNRYMDASAARFMQCVGGYFTSAVVSIGGGYSVIPGYTLGIAMGAISSIVCNAYADQVWKEGRVDRGKLATACISSTALGFVGCILLTGFILPSYRAEYSSIFIGLLTQSIKAGSDVYYVRLLREDLSSGTLIRFSLYGIVSSIVGLAAGLLLGGGLMGGVVLSVVCRVTYQAIQVNSILNDAGKLDV